MSTRTRIPPLLEPYLRLPPELGLTLITGTLECTPTWLMARVVGSLISSRATTTASETGNEDKKPGERGMAVILVSWMRDAAFWRAELRRTVGMDISRLEAGDCYGFIDCLSPSRNAQPDPLQDLVDTVTATATRLATNGRKSIHLILDQPDVLLALHPTTLPAHALSTSLLHLRTLVHSTTLTLSADLPFIAAATSTSSAQVRATPLEKATAAFLVQQAHVARLVMSCRPLATGAARDISGVLRATRGGYAYGGETDDDDDDGSGEAELLYLTSRDGGVKVFARGAES